MRVKSKYSYEIYIQPKYRYEGTTTRVPLAPMGAYGHPWRPTESPISLMSPARDMWNDGIQICISKCGVYYTRALTISLHRTVKSNSNFDFILMTSARLFGSGGGVTKLWEKHENPLPQLGHHYFGQRNHYGVSKTQLYQKSFVCFLALEASFFGFFQKFKKCGQPIAVAHHLLPIQGPLKWWLISGWAKMLS